MTIRDRIFKKLFPKQYKRAQLKNRESVISPFPAITKAIKDEFPQYGEVFYTNGFNNYSGELTNRGEKLVFFTPNDLKDAQENQHLERIIDIVYSILISQNDEYKRFWLQNSDVSREDFKPQLLSRRDLTSEQLWSLGIETGNTPMGV